MTQPFSKKKKKDLIPTYVSNVIDGKKGFIVTHTNDKGEKVGYYLNSNGNYSYRELPDMCTKPGSEYTDMTALFEEKYPNQVDYIKNVQVDFGREGRVANRLKNDSTFAGMFGEMSGPELSDETKEKIESDYFRRRKEKEAAETKEKEAKEAEKKAKEAEAEAKRQYSERVSSSDRASMSAGSNKDVNIRAIKDKKYKPMYSYKQMKAKLNDWGGIFKNLTSHILRMAGAESGYMGQIVGLTIKPITDRMASIPKIIDNVFKNAGIDDPNKWFEDHAGTAKAKLLLEKTNKMAAGMYDCVASTQEELAKYALESLMAKGVDENGVKCEWTKAKQVEFMTNVKNGNIPDFAEYIDWDMDDSAGHNRTKRFKEFVENKYSAAYVAYSKDKENHQKHAEVLSYAEMRKGIGDASKLITPIYESPVFLKELATNMKSNGMTVEEINSSLETTADALINAGYKVTRYKMPARLKNPKKEEEEIKHTSPVGHVVNANGTPQTGTSNSNTDEVYNPA